MGLGITMNIPTMGIFKEKTRKKIRAYFEELPSVVPGQDVRVYEDDEGFQVRLVPFEENVYVRFEENAAVISARTNSAGPGYHAYFVGVLDNLARETGAKLSADSVDDETEYYASRDFLGLQGSMTAWASSLANVVIENYGGRDYKNLAISMPLEQTPVSEDGFVCYPLGYLDELTFRKMQRKEDLGTIMPRFFLWWDEGLTADFYRKAALSMMWQEVNWLPPIAAEDGRVDDSVYRSVLACLEKAWALDGTLAYPEAEWIEMAGLVGDEALCEALNRRFPEAAGKEPEIGFLRGWVNSMLPAGWRIEHPGKMYFDGTEASVWWNDDLTLRVSVISFQPQEGGIADPNETLSLVSADEPFEPFPLKDKNVPAKILTKQIEEEGELLWQTVLHAVSGNTILIATLYYAERETESLALKICGSLSAQTAEQ